MSVSHLLSSQLSLPGTQVVLDADHRFGVVLNREAQRDRCVVLHERHQAIQVLD